MRSQEQRIWLSLGMERMFASLVGGFGLIQALLAAIGLYGLMAYGLEQRFAFTLLRDAFVDRADPCADPPGS